MNDAGAIRILSGGETYQAAGNRILNNKIHDTNDASAIGDADGYGGDGVYRVSRAAVNITMNAYQPGFESNIHNNVFAYSRLSMIQNNRPYPDGVVPTPDAIRVFEANDNILYFTRQGNPFDASAADFYVQGGCTYSGGHQFDQFQLRAGNLYWRTDGSFASDPYAFRHQPNQGLITEDPANDVNTICNSALPGTHTFLDFAGWQAFGQDIGSTVQDPGFTNPVYPHDDFSLPATSAGAGVVNVSVGGYEPQLAGRTSATLTPPPVPATFPTARFDPATGF